MSQRPGLLSDRFSLWCLLGFVLLTVRPASAARLLDVYIEQDGNVVAHTYYDDGGRADAATVWRYLAEPPIMVEDEVTSIVPTEEDPLIAVLSGDLVIKIQHVDRVIAEAPLSSLRLQRESEQTVAWFLPHTEVERTAFMAGLDPPAPPAEVRDSYLLTVGTCLLILFGCIVLTFLLLRGPRVVS